MIIRSQETQPRRLSERPTSLGAAEGAEGTGKMYHVFATTCKYQFARMGRVAADDRQPVGMDVEISSHKETVDTWIWDCFVEG